MQGKKYQVFVSSTYEDLKDERQEVMRAVLKLDCISCRNGVVSRDRREFVVAHSPRHR